MSFYNKKDNDFSSLVFKNIYALGRQWLVVLMLFVLPSLAKKQNFEKNLFNSAQSQVVARTKLGRVEEKDINPILKSEAKQNKKKGFSQKLNSIWTENPELQKDINKYFKNKPISKKEIQKFLIKNSYYQAQLTQTNKVYIIKNPFQVIFIFKGNHLLTEKEIRKLIKIDESKMGAFFYSFIETTIKSIYQSQGFLKIKIKKQTVKKPWKKWVYLNIVEGPRIQIAELKVKGLLSKPNNEYESFIKNNSSDLIRKGFYNKKDLELGYDNLINHLKSQGYLQSKIYSDRIFFKEDKAFITINLEEGPLTLIKDIQIQKAEAIPLWEILSHIQSRIQSTLKIDLLQEDLNRIEQLYKNRGYLNMKITNRDNVIQYTPGERYASIVIQIEEGPKALVSQISIKGLKRSKKDLVRQLLKFKEGDVLTLSAKEQSIKALGKTGLWTDVSFIENRVNDQFVVTARFKERKARSLRGGMGLNSQRGLTTHAYTELSHRNLFGWGRAFIMRGKGQISLTEQKPFLEYEISGRYKEVFIPSYAYQGNVSLTQSQNLFKHSQENINFVKKTQVSFFIDKDINADLKMKWNIFSFENRREACTVELNCPEKPQKIASTGFKLVWDKRDNIFDPSKGTLSSLSLELASPFLGSSEDISFIKTEGQQEWHWTLIKNYNLGLTVKGGLIHAFQDSPNIPVSRAFILGGQNSLRGYDGNIEGERIPSQKYAPVETANEPLRLEKAVIENVRYSHYGLTNIDFRFPVFEKLKAVLFYDLGAVYLKSSRQKVLTYGHSVGIGFRYQTFLIPIGLDIAYKLPPKEGTNYRLHFFYWLVKA